MWTDSFALNEDIGVNIRVTWSKCKQEHGFCEISCKPKSRACFREQIHDCMFSSFSIGNGKKNDL